MPPFYFVSRLICEMPFYWVRKFHFALTFRYFLSWKGNAISKEIELAACTHSGPTYYVAWPFLLLPCCPLFRYFRVPIPISFTGAQKMDFRLPNSETYFILEHEYKIFFYLSRFPSKQSASDAPELDIRCGWTNPRGPR